jgi:ABC-type glycerol-3-phosphate transport system permease component
MTEARRSVSGTLAMALTTGLVMLWLFPIYWIFLTSFKTPLLINEKDPVFFFGPTLENYHHLFTEFRFARV